MFRYLTLTMYVRELEKRGINEKELRGRRTKDYSIDYIADLSWITKYDYNLSDGQITIINDECRVLQPSNI